MRISFSKLHNVIITGCLLTLASCASGGIIEKLSGGEKQPSVFSSPASDRIGSGKNIVGLLVSNEDNSRSGGMANSIYLSGKLAAESLKGSPITLIVRRHDHSEASVNKAVRELVRAGVEIIIGPDTKLDGAKMTSLSGGKRIPFLTISETHDLDNNIFGAGPNLVGEASFVAGELKKRGKKRSIIAFLQKPASALYADHLSQALAKAGIQTERLDIGDPATVFDRLEQLSVTGPIKPDSILFAVSAEQATKLISSLKQHPKLSHLEMVGHSGWALGVQLLPQDEKIWFSSYSKNNLHQFRDKFIAANEQNPSLLGAVTFDMVVLASVLPQIIPEDPFKTEILTNEKGFNGQTGHFSFDTSGRAQRAYVVSHPKEHS